MHESLRVGSLFSGIGGFDLGLERTGGFRTAWFCEQDEFCQHVLAQHWPGVPCYPDVTALRGADVEPVEVIVGGFPCQDLSLAGTGAGLDGARSGLWSEYARLIGELRPRYVIVENVAALLARGLGTVLGDLASLGYDAEWDCIPASAVGAPHRRDRVWIVAYPGGVEHEGASDAQRRPSAARLPEAVADTARYGRGQGRQGRPAGDGSDGQDLASSRVADAESEPVWPGLRADEPGGQRRGRSSDGGSARAADEGRPLDDAVRGRHGASDRQVRAGRDGSVDAGGWAVEPDVGRVADGVPARVDRLRALGNALVPQIPEWIGLRILEWEHARDC